MSTLIQPIALLAIILTGYLFKRAGKFKNRDYRIMQVALFNLVLPCAIIYSFATNPHDSSMLWISVFGFVVAFIPPVLIFLTTRHTPVQDRAFTMLNGPASTSAASASPWHRRFSAPRRSCQRPCSTSATA